MQETIIQIAVFLILAGFLGLLAGLMLVYKRMNTAQLSMNIFSGNTREHHQKLSWKWPWNILQEPEVDMRASVILTSGGIEVMSWDQFLATKAHNITPRPYETKDGVLFGTWATAVMPLKGHLNNMIKRTPGTGALMTLAKIELAMSRAVHDLTTEEALGQKNDIGEIVAKVFGGEKTTTEHERAYGLSVLDPELFDLNFGKKSQDAAEKRLEAQQFRKAVEDMLQAAGGDADKARSAVEVATGMAQRNIFQLEGLEGAVKNIAEAFFSKRS